MLRTYVLVGFSDTLFLGAVCTIPSNVSLFEVSALPTIFGAFLEGQSSDSAGRCGGFCTFAKMLRLRLDRARQATSGARVLQVEDILDSE